MTAGAAAAAVEPARDAVRNDELEEPNEPNEPVGVVALDDELDVVGTGGTIDTGAVELPPLLLVDVVGVVLLLVLVLVVVLVPVVLAVVLAPMAAAAAVAAAAAAAAAAEAAEVKLKVVAAGAEPGATEVADAGGAARSSKRVVQ